LAISDRRIFAERVRLDLANINSFTVCQQYGVRQIVAEPAPLAIPTRILAAFSG
jgi:hypothetical protein